MHRLHRPARLLRHMQLRQLRQPHRPCGGCGPRLYECREPPHGAFRHRGARRPNGRSATHHTHRRESLGAFRQLAQWRQCRARGRVHHLRHGRRRRRGRPAGAALCRRAARPRAFADVAASFPPRDTQPIRPAHRLVLAGRLHSQRVLGLEPSCQRGAVERLDYRGHRPDAL